jgi:hypothetical protein
VSCVLCRVVDFCGIVSHECLFSGLPFTNDEVEGRARRVARSSINLNW